MKNAQFINESSVELDGRYSTITSHKKLLLWFSMCFVSYWVKPSNLKYFEEYLRFVRVCVWAPRTFY